MAWVFSWDKLFKVSCAPETWRHTVQHLINSTQLIVVDLSHVSEGLKWELDEVQFYGATDKLVFVSYEESFNEARSFIESYGISECHKKIFMYGNNGFAARHEELSAMLASVASTRAAANNSFNPTPR